ncbi:hypothetical protein [Paenibacillus polymyxa]|uniref:hypothetical protein n=1 Tax=Paenibacillus polymyxa TaxID=1406 RepID=UPI00287FF32F|nr:hypothetical protein [Paenibacillus polymyxa]
METAYPSHFDYIYGYDAGDKQWFEVKREDVAAQVNYGIPILIDPDKFDQVRRATIIDVVQSNLVHYTTLTINTPGLWALAIHLPFLGKTRKSGIIR